MSRARKTCGHTDFLNSKIDEVNDTMCGNSIGRLVYLCALYKQTLHK